MREPVFEAADNRLIRPRRRFRQVLHHRVFLAYWIRRNVLARYRQTTLGPVWALLQPLVSGLVYAFVFAWLLRVETGVPYAVFVVTNLALWTYTARTILVGPSALLGNLDLVTRVQFPREFLPLAVWIESLIDLALSGLVVGAFFIAYGVALTPYALWAIPVFLVHSAFTVGAMFLVAAITISVRDVAYIVPLVLQLALYLAPVVYPLQLVPESAHAWYLLNPLAAVFAGYEDALFGARFAVARELAVSAAVSAVMLAAGYRLFKRQEWLLADLL